MGFAPADGQVKFKVTTGGRVNATLRYALESLGHEWKVIPDNFLVKVRGESATREAFEAAQRKLREPAFWSDVALWKEVAEALPTYRLSKFQVLMPPWVEREVVAHYLLDVDGARLWMAGEGELPASAQTTR